MTQRQLATECFRRATRNRTKIGIDIRHDCIASCLSLIGIILQAATPVFFLKRGCFESFSALSCIPSSPTFAWFDHIVSLKLLTFCHSINEERRYLALQHTENDEYSPIHATGSPFLFLLYSLYAPESSMGRQETYIIIIQPLCLFFCFVTASTLDQLDFWNFLCRLS